MCKVCFVGADAHGRDGRVLGGGGAAVVVVEKIQVRVLALHARVGYHASAICQQLCAVHLFDVMHSVRCLRNWGTYLQVGQITMNWRR